MFSRSRKRNAASEQFTYLAQDTVLRGGLEAQGRVRVHGRVEGDVKVAGLLEVAAEGVIRGSLVEAADVRILGEVVADVVATGKIEIWEGGRLTGDVKAAALDIEEGAHFEGRSEMRPAGAVARLPEETRAGEERKGQEGSSAALPLGTAARAEPGD